MECPWSSSSPSIASALASLPQAVNLPKYRDREQKRENENREREIEREQRGREIETLTCCETGAPERPATPWFLDGYATVIDLHKK
jgi:hypothetical protein